MRKTHPFTLIELMISLVLTSIVLTALLFFYQQVVTLGKDLDAVESEGFYHRFVESRLADILPRIKGVTNKKQNLIFLSTDDAAFTMPSSQSLIFTFDHRFSKDKIFSNVIIGRLYVDKKGQLTIAYWPAPKQWEADKPLRMKKEVVLQGVKSLAFQFYVAPDKEKKEELQKDDKKPLANPSLNNEEKPPQLQEGWHDMLWPKERQELPAMIRVVIKLEDEKTMMFIFPLVNSSARIIYGCL